MAIVLERVFSWARVALAVGVVAVSGLAGWKHYTMGQDFIVAMLFLVAFLVMAAGMRWIASRMEEAAAAMGYAARKMNELALQVLFGALILLAACIIASHLFPQDFKRAQVIAAISLQSILYPVWFLLKELWFLAAKSQADAASLRHLEKQLVEAEINILKNELEPHFVYNTLMPMYYLIVTDTEKAREFAHKLIQVYQYFLANRHRNFVSLQEELDFTKSFFYLQQVRYKGAISLDIRNEGSHDLHSTDVLPFAMQTLVENAIKHNEFDQEHILRITIRIERDFLIVKNSYSPSNKNTSGTRLGLKNLIVRYRLLANSDVTVFKTREAFAVKLPLLNHSSREYDFADHY